MDRTVTYFVNTILPDSIEKNQRVLISSSENAIRGLLMHLCDIPQDRISEVEIPTGLPLLYNLNKRCIQLLDDGKLYAHNDALRVHNFGASPELLFFPKRNVSIGSQSAYNKDGEEHRWDPVIRLNV